MVVTIRPRAVVISPSSLSLLAVGLLFFQLYDKGNMSGPCWTTRLFNRISSKRPGWRNDLQAANMDPSPSSFYHDELGRVLSEQSFGLTRYEVAGQSSSHEATAVVTLLEGANINVSLNIRGYQLDGGQTHESIEELLQSISPMYVRKREESIISKLQSLQ